MILISSEMAYAISY